MPQAGHDYATGGRHRAVEWRCGACARAPTMATIDEILPRHPISLVAMDSFAPFRGGNGSGSHVDLSCAPFIATGVWHAEVYYQIA